jgi:two-component sensor histidine kinase
MKPAFGWLRRVTEKIGFRLAFLLSVALLPFGVVAVVQSTALLTEVRARSEAALTGKTMRAAEDELRTILGARGVAFALSKAVVPVIDDPAACSAMMTAIAREAEVYSLVGFVPLNGKMECSSTGAPFDFSTVPGFLAVMADPKATLVVNKKGPVSKVAVVGIIHPVNDAAGSFVGMLTISVPHSTLTGQKVKSPGAVPPVMMTFNKMGEVLTSSVGLEAAAALLPRDRSLIALAGEDDLAFTASTPDGSERAFSVVPIVPGTLYALGSWPSDRASVWLVKALPSAVLPTVFWLACLLVVWLGTEGLVTRHIRSMQSAITSFAGGNRMVGRIELEGAPLELRQLGFAFDKMTDSILHDEAELEDVLHQKEVLLREVHHRVKNNLQLIASIMNMQMRQAKSPEAKFLMKGLQDRVMSLATIHRGLYQTSGLTDIRADELLTDIVRQVVTLATGPGRRIEVTTSIVDLRMTPDQAVPLSLLLTEALTNAMKYAGANNGDTPRLDVALRREGGTGAVLEVSNTVGIHPREDDGFDTGTGLGAQLLMAFAQQIGGHVETIATETGYNLRVTFDVRPLAEAEARNEAEVRNETA